MKNQKVVVNDCCQEKKPVVLNLVYFRCPRVCNYATDGVVDVVNKMSSLNLGSDFKILTVSFNPEDDFKQSSSKIAKYYKLLDDRHFPKGNWHFLTSDSQAITTLTESVCYKYKKKGEEFAHQYSVILISHDEIISSYL